MAVSTNVKIELKDFLDLLERSDEKKRQGEIAAIGRKIARVRKNKKYTSEDKEWMISELKKIGR